MKKILLCLSICGVVSNNLYNAEPRAKLLEWGKERNIRHGSMSEIPVAEWTGKGRFIDIFYGLGYPYCVYKAPYHSTTTLRDIHSCILCGVEGTFEINSGPFNDYGRVPSLDDLASKYEYVSLFFKPIPVINIDLLKMNKQGDRVISREKCVFKRASRGWSCKQFITFARKQLNNPMISLYVTKYPQGTEPDPFIKNLQISDYDTTPMSIFYDAYREFELILFV